MEVDTFQAQRNLVTDFLAQHTEAFTVDVDCEHPVVVDYVWVLAIQDALKPQERPWYSVVSATDVTYRSLGLLEAAHDVLTAQDTDE